MSATIPEHSAPPTPGVNAGTILPASEPGRLERRQARASELEYQNSGDPNWSEKYQKKPKKRAPKPPKDSKIYKAVVAYLALKAQGLKGPEIAEQLGLTPGTLRQYVHDANKRGWLNIESFALPEDRVDVVLASKAVRNINNVLDETHETENGERVMTARAVDISLEVAKGVGLLKQHQVVKGDNGAPNVFALKVEVINPGVGGSSVQQIRTGSVGGRPAFDAEIIENRE